VTDSPESDTYRQPRIEAARIARAAVAGEMTVGQARENWPLEEGVDPSVDALAHIYFDHYVYTQRRRTPDEYDTASVMELADAMSEGNPLDDELLRGFEPIREYSGGCRSVLAIAVVVVLLAYLIVRLF